MKILIASASLRAHCDSISTAHTPVMTLSRSASPWRGASTSGRVINLLCALGKCSVNTLINSDMAHRARKVFPITSIFTSTSDHKQNECRTESVHPLHIPITRRTRIDFLEIVFRETGETRAQSAQPTDTQESNYDYSFFLCSERSELRKKSGCALHRTPTEIVMSILRGVSELSRIREED